MQAVKEAAQEAKDKAVAEKHTASSDDTKQKHLNGLSIK